MYHRPRHRAPFRRRPTFKRAAFAAVAALTLLAAAALGSSASADTDLHFIHAVGAHHTAKPPKGKPHASQSGPHKPKPGDDDANDAGATPDPTATNGGKSLPGDEGLNPTELKPTAAPLTPYEMPFPCNEVWTGSTRAGHSPSVRAVDFNYPGGDPVSYTHLTLPTNREV